jgi:hypothetical protein
MSKEDSIEVTGTGDHVTMELSPADSAYRSPSTNSP